MILLWWWLACASPTVQTGVASWYGKEFAGRPTASGERFHPSRLTAAHPTLPFGSVLRVTRLDNGRSVKVVVNDRGPYSGGRVLDLSKHAARRLGVVRDGTARVRLQLVGCRARYHRCDEIRKLRRKLR
jgi:rare lipoprotein A